MKDPVVASIEKLVDEANEAATFLKGVAYFTPGLRKGEAQTLLSIRNLLKDLADHVEKFGLKGLRQEGQQYVTINAQNITTPEDMAWDVYEHGAAQYAQRFENERAPHRHDYADPVRTGVQTVENFETWGTWYEVIEKWTYRCVCGDEIVTRRSVNGPPR